MTGEKVDSEEVKAKAGGKPQEHDRSTIVFPYFTLGAAEEVARAVYARTGLGSCPVDELAAELHVTMSGNFRLKNSAARIFGIVEKSSADAYALTDLGARLMHQSSEADARASAFLHVPLYVQIFDKYRGKLLPPTKALEREMVGLGVAPKQADRARQIFQRSARDAGYFNSGEDRLVRPRTTSGESVADTVDQKVADERPREDRRTSQRFYGGGDVSGGRYHPFVEGLLERLPEPDTVWTIDGRAAWLEAAASVFKLIYQGDGRITIEAEEASERQNGRSRRETAA